MTEWGSPSATNIPREACVEPCVDTGLPMNCLWGLHARLMHTRLHTIPTWCCAQQCVYTKLHANSRKGGNYKKHVCMSGVKPQLKIIQCLPIHSRLEDEGGPTHTYKKIKHQQLVSPILAGPVNPNTRRSLRSVSPEMHCPVYVA